MVAEATFQNGILQSNEQGVITWLAGPGQIASASLTIDGTAISPLFGPIPFGPNQSAFSGVFGPLSVGDHTFAIGVTSSVGTTAAFNGTFTVSA